MRIVLVCLLVACVKVAPPPEPDAGEIPPDPSIELVVTMPGDTPPASVPRISGETPELGEWDGVGRALEHGVDGRYRTRITFTGGRSSVQFKFTLGDWSTVEKRRDGSERPNREVRKVGNSLEFLTVERWAGPRSCGSTYTGDVRRHVKLGENSITGLAARDVLVWLPPGYSESGPALPVLYLHDGQNTMDACTSFGGVEWGVDETATARIAAGTVAPVILVAIENTPDRIAEYTPVTDPENGGGRADDYFTFVAQSVIPAITLSYRVRMDASTTGIAGSSLGGLVSLWFGLHHDDFFGRVGVLSPSVWWSDRAILDDVSALPSKPPLRLWESIGTAESDGETVDDARALRDALVSKGFIEGTELRYVEVEGGRHDEASWAARFGDVLEWLYPPEFPWIAMTGVLEHMHVVRERQGPSIRHPEAWFRVGGGVPTDQRDRPGVKRPVSAIAAETLDRLSKELGIPIAPGASRRNLTIRGLALDTLPRGTVLGIGEAEFTILGPCDPCEKMEHRIGPGAFARMDRAGGLILSVTSPGRVACGDAVRVVSLGDRPLHVSTAR